MTCPDIILKNIVIFMNKVILNPELLPSSVLQTIAADSPSPGNPTHYLDSWYTKYSSTPYNTSVFFKGPLLYNLVSTDEKRVIANDSQQSFKISLKSYLLLHHKYSEAKEWSLAKLKLFHIEGLRKSERIKNQQNTINYCEI